MYRLAALILVFSFLSLGSGALEYLHNLQHAREDAAADAALAVPTDPSTPAHHAPLHDDSNCPVHAQLHLPTLPIAWVPLLICLGLFIAFLSMLAPIPVSQPAFSYIDSRGPPAC